jgi:hypothetical protein
MNVEEKGSVSRPMLYHIDQRALQHLKNYVAKAAARRHPATHEGGGPEHAIL